MKIEDLSQEVKDKVKQLLEDAPADQKADAIMQSIEMIQEATHGAMLQCLQLLMHQEMPVKYRIPVTARPVLIYGNSGANG